MLSSNLVCGNKVDIARIVMAKLFAIFSFIIMSLVTVQTASAQSREIINPSFEDGPNPGTFVIHSDALHPGWNSTDGLMETWADGFEMRDAQEGDYLVELNPNNPVGLYQEVCLVANETLSWDIQHAARGETGGADQTLVYEVISLDGSTTIQSLFSNTVTPMGLNPNDQTENLWDNVTGSTVYTGPTGVQRLQFRSTNPGSFGNFLDNINIALIPVVTFENLNTSALETATTGLPQFAISGDVPTGFSIGFTITGGTAIQGTDYTVTSNSIAIPAGNYDGVSPGSIFPVPISILTDAIVEGNETIEITYQNVTPSTAAVLSGPSCTPAATSAVHTILDVPPSLEIEKTLSANADEDGSNSVSIGDTLTYTVIATNTGAAAQTGFVVTDNLITPSSNTCPSVQAGGTCVLTGTYVVNVADASGDIVNTASIVSDQVTVPLEDTVTTPVDSPSPALDIVKTLTSNVDEDSSGSVSIGDTLNYEVVVTNSGNITQNNVLVTDNLIAPSSNTCASVAVGATCILTGTYVVTMADAGGDVVNTASAVSDEVTTPVTDTVTTPVIAAAPTLAIAKPAPANADEDGSGTVSVGDTLTYTITATNTGNLDQSDVEVTDPLITPSSNICATVPVGGTCVLTGTYVVQAGDAGGDIVNTAEATSNEVPTPVSATQTTPVPAAPALDIVKTLANNADEDSSGTVSIGDTLTYEIVATNSGNVAQTNVEVIDSMLVNNSQTICASVAVGATCTLTGSYVVTMADAGGDVVNTASAESDEVTTPVTDTVTTPVDPATPALDIVKTLTNNADEDGSNSVSIGDTLTYTIVATNSGNFDQNNVVVTDNLIAPNSNTCASVAVGATCTLTGDYVVTMTDAGGDVVNTASAESDEVTTPVTDSVTTPVIAATPTLAITKPAPSNNDADGSGTVSVGDTLTYTITATNTGNLDQTDVEVTDPLITPSTETCATVPVGGTCVLTGSYVVQAGDAGGDIVNTAEATSNEVPTPVSATQTTPVPAAPALDIVKTLTNNADEDSSGTVSIGDTLTYEIVATNSGNIAQNDVVVTDNLITPNSNTCATVAVGATCTLSGTYVVTMADEGGDVVNTASAESDEVTTPVTDTVTTAVDAAAPALDLRKTFTNNADEDGSNSISIGDTLTYNVDATNTGNIAQSNVVVSDNVITPSSNTCATVAVGATCTLTGTYVVTASDAGGNFVNTASVVSDQIPTPVTDVVTVAVDAAAPALDIVKTLTSNLDEDGSNSVSVGDTLTYEIVATNDGNIAQNNVVVTDNLITPNSNTCSTVAVGATCTLTGDYVVTMTDAGGDVVNTASAESDEVTTPVTDSVTTPVDPPAPSLSLAKPAPANADEDGSGTVSVGDTLTYTITATNTGNVTQANIVVSDPMITPTTETCASVLVGGTCVLTGTYTVQASDAGGNIDNTAEVTSDEVPTPVEATETTPVPAAPAFDISKPAPSNADEDGSGTVSIDDTLTYTITATNTGNVTLTNVVVFDSQIEPSTEICTTVPVGGTCVLTGTYVVEIDDAVVGNIVNTASVVSGEGLTPVEDTVTTPVDAAAPEIDLVKTLSANADEDGSSSVSIGDTLTYTIVATNSGNIAQNNVVVTDRFITPNSNTCASVAVGATCTLTGTYVVTMVDAGGDVVNTASVVSDEVPTPVTDTVTTPVDGAAPAIDLVKTLTSNADEDGSSSVSIGDTLTYTIVATNTGNTAQTNFVVTDNLITPNSNTCATVAVGGTCTLTGTYVVTAADAGGDIVNTASVVSDEVPTPVTDTVTTPVVPAAPAIGLVKTLTSNADEDGSSSVSIGDTLTYTIVATNTGNTAQTNFVVTDNLITPNSNTCATVPVGGTCTLTGAYVVTAADAGGDVVNTASVVSDEVPTPVEDTVTTPVVPAVPAIDLVKTLTSNADEDGSSSVSIGDTLTYTIVATNTGNTAQTNFVVTDNLITPNSNTCATVPVGGTCTLTGTYVVTAADAGGDIVNTGSVVSDEVPTPVEDTVTTPVDGAAPAIDLVKTLTSNVDEDGSSSVSIGDTLTYTIVATNTGNIAQTNFVVTDNLITPSSNTCATVAVGATCTLTGDYVVTAADAGGDIVNTASVVSDQVPTPVTDTVTTPVDSAAPALDIAKPAPANADEDGSGTVSVGDTLTYIITATNTGNAAQTDVEVIDPLITPSSNICATVPVGGTCVLTGTYVVQAGDAGGDIVNTAETTSNEVPTPVSASQTTPVPAAPAIDLVKTLTSNADEDGSSTVSIGDTLTYTIVATNTGNIAQTNFVVTDNLITPSSNTCATVAVGATCTLTGDYVVTAADAGGDIVNTASVVSDQVPTPVTDTVTTPVDGAASAIDLVKILSANADEDGSSSVSIGDTLTYTIVATNTGNAAQSNFVVTDNLITPSSNTCATVAVGATCTLTGTYVVTTADAGGDIVNTASVVSDEVPTPVTDTVTTPVDGAAPAIDLVKALTSNADEDGSSSVSIGDTLTYTIVATNSGNAAQTNFVVTDNLITPSSNTCASVAVGGTCTLTGTYVVTAADAGGDIVNTASVVSDEVPTPVTDTVTTPVDGAAPAIDLVKTLSANADEDGSSSVSIGDTLTYTIIATNTGNAAQTNFVVTDNLITPNSNTCAPVAVGGTCTLSGKYVVTASDAGGDIVNTASVVSDQVPTPVTDTVTTPVDGAAPAIDLVKTLTSNADEDGSSSVSIGDTLTYTIIATNTGNAAQTNFVVTDNLITPSSHTCASVAVGATCTLTGTYVVTAADAGGNIVNTASVISDQVTTPVEDTVTTPVDTAAAIIEAEPDVVAGIDSAVGGTNVINVLDDDLLNGQPINPGQVSVDFTPDATIPAGILFNPDGSVDVAPGTPAGTYVIPYEICDVNDPTNCTASTVTIVVNAPTGLTPLTITKSTPISNVNIGDIVPYTITVTNTENASRLDVDIVDFAPPGFRLIEETSTLDGTQIEPVVAGRELVLEGIDFTANQTRVWTLHMAIGAGVGDGAHTNQAFIRDASGAEISARAEAVVKMTEDPLFDCSEIIGKVFDDENRNGYQDQGEPGIAGVRLATVKGLIIISDEHGRFHIACAEVPNSNIGSNFILKVDERSLPTGYRMTTENPRVERLTRGKISKINFGASIQRVVTLDLSNEAFLPGSTKMQAAMMPNIAQLVQVLRTEPSVLKLNYHDYEGFGGLSDKRIAAVEAEMQKLWKAQGCCYILEIEKKILRPGGLQPSHALRRGAFR